MLWGLALISACSPTLGRTLSPWSWWKSSVSPSMHIFLWRACKGLGKNGILSAHSWKRMYACCVTVNKLGYFHWCGLLYERKLSLLQKLELKVGLAANNTHMTGSDHELEWSFILCLFFLFLLIKLQYLMVAYKYRLLILPRCDLI